MASRIFAHLFSRARNKNLVVLNFRSPEIDIANKYKVINKIPNKKIKFGLWCEICVLKMPYYVKLALADAKKRDKIDEFYSVDTSNIPEF